MHPDRLERFTRLFLIFTTIYVSMFAVLSLLVLWLQIELILTILSIVRFLYFGPMIYLIVFVNGVLQLVQVLAHRSRGNLIRLLVAFIDGMIVIGTVLYIIIEFGNALSTF